DPVAGFDPVGNPLLVGMVVNPKAGPYFLPYLFASGDGGATFSANRIPLAPNESLDKPWFAVNSFNNSPHFGRILAVWTGWPDISVNNFTGLRSAYSDDGGLNWSTPLKITSSTAFQTGHPVFLPDGSCVLVYGDEGHLELRQVRSSDGGATFGAPTVIAKIVEDFDPKY